MVKAVRTGVPAGSDTHRSPLLSINSTPQVVSSISASIARAHSVRVFSSPKVSIRS